MKNLQEWWNKEPPEIGDWVEFINVKTEGPVIPFIGTRDPENPFFIRKRNGPTRAMSLYNYAWRPLPDTLEVVRLRKEVGRLRDGIMRHRNCARKILEGVFPTHVDMDLWKLIETQEGGGDE